MEKRVSVLFLGESWIIQTTESKGVDSFTVYRYEEAAYWVGDAVREGNMDFRHIPGHRIEFDFPNTLEALKKYDVVMISDVGANTFLIPTVSFVHGERSVNKLALIRDYVADGGALCMIGGYMTFQGFQGRACYKRTPIEEVLPVSLFEGDDRAEYPEGFNPEVLMPKHPIFEGIDETFPYMLGYNRTLLKKGAQLLACHGEDPMIAIQSYGKGRAMAYACDCSPHWASPELCNWKYYKRLWQNIVRWLAQV